MQRDGQEKESERRVNIIFTFIIFELRVNIICVTDKTGYRTLLLPYVTM